MPDTKKWTGKPVYVERALIRSKAMAALRTVASIRVLLAFFMRCRKEQRSRSKRSGWVITNNGELILTYREAERDLGISRQAFGRAIDDLIRVGFLDIAEPGNGVARTATRYSVSERWRNFETPAFIEQRRKPDTRGLGYQRRR